MRIYVYANGNLERQRQTEGRMCVRDGVMKRKRRRERESERETGSPKKRKGKVG
jgi:hypothetical protein